VLYQENHQDRPFLDSERSFTEIDLKWRLSMADILIAEFKSGFLIIAMALLYLLA
jgi:hypothetical protein